jgi:molybdopterin converting factor small subunit
MPTSITLQYQGTIRDITHTDFEKITVEGNCTVEKLLSQLLFQYPLLLLQCYEATFELRLNSTFALGSEVLTNGDVVVVKN